MPRTHVATSYSQPRQRWGARSANSRTPIHIDCDQSTNQHFTGSYLAILAAEAVTTPGVDLQLTEEALICLDDLPCVFTCSVCSSPKIHRSRHAKQSTAQTHKTTRPAHPMRAQEHTQPAWDTSQLAGHKLRTQRTKARGASYHGELVLGL